MVVLCMSPEMFRQISDPFAQDGYLYLRRPCIFIVQPVICDYLCLVFFDSHKITTFLSYFFALLRLAHAVSFCKPRNGAALPPRSATMRLQRRKGRPVRRL